MSIASATFSDGPDGLMATSVAARRRQSRDDTAETHAASRAAGGRESRIRGMFRWCDHRPDPGAHADRGPGCDPGPDRTPGHPADPRVAPGPDRAERPRT